MTNLHELILAKSRERCGELLVDSDDSGWQSLRGPVAAQCDGAIWDVPVCFVLFRFFLS